MTHPSSHAVRSVPLSATDFHVLLVLAADDLYGYAILKAVEEESKGTVSPEIGSLYRVLGRLMSLGLVDEVAPPAKAPDVHRGRPRRYYRLTREGRAVLKAEASRLQGALEIARARALLPEASRS
jgi:DNA-binding PadR family transcriptional regulator